MMAFQTKELVREYWAMGFSVQDTVAVLNIHFSRGFTWDEVADMYMQIECEEEGK
jgi:hypothetical protein